MGTLLRKNSSRWVSSWALASGLLWLGACGPGNNSEPTAHVQLQMSDRAMKAAGYNGQSLNSLMSDDYCYAVHVHTPNDPTSTVMFNRTKTPTAEDGPRPACPYQPYGPGIVSTNFAAPGGELALELPVGTGRRFDLIAVAKSVIGSCSKTLSFKNVGNDTAFVVGGVPMDLDDSVKILAHSGLVDVGPGENTVTLSQVVATSVASVPYLCDDNNTSGGTGTTTKQFRIMIPGATNSNEVFSAMPNQYYALNCPINAVKVRMQIADVTAVLDGNYAPVTASGNTFETACQIRADWGGRNIAVFGLVSHAAGYENKAVKFTALTATNAVVETELSYKLRVGDAYRVTGSSSLPSQSAPTFSGFQQDSVSGGYASVVVTSNVSGDPVLNQFVLASVTSGAPNMYKSVSQTATGSGVQIGNRVAWVGGGSLSDSFFDLSSVMTTHSSFNTAQGISSWRGLGTTFAYSGNCNVNEVNISNLTTGSTPQMLASGACPTTLGKGPVIRYGAQAAFLDTPAAGYYKIYNYNSTNWVNTTTSITALPTTAASYSAVANSDTPGRFIGTVLNATATAVTSAGFAVDFAPAPPYVTDLGCSGAFCTTGTFYPAWSGTGTKLSFVKSVTVEDLNGFNDADLVKFEGSQTFIAGGALAGQSVAYRSPDAGQHWYRVFVGGTGENVVDAIPVVLDFGSVVDGKPYRAPGVALLVYNSTTQDYRIYLQNFTGY